MKNILIIAAIVAAVWYWKTKHPAAEALEKLPTDDPLYISSDQVSEGSAGTGTGTTGNISPGHAAANAAATPFTGFQSKSKSAFL